MVEMTQHTNPFNEFRVKRDTQSKNKNVDHHSESSDNKCPANRNKG